jgi:hypothetical protein
MSFQVDSNCPSGLFLVVPSQGISVLYRIIYRCRLERILSGATCHMPMFTSHEYDIDQRQHIQNNWSQP